MSRRVRIKFLCLTICLLSGALLAQRSRRPVDTTNPRAYMDGEPIEQWALDNELPKDVFTFARVRYSSGGGYGRWGGGWTTDYPDADLNLSYRLHQLTSLRVHPDGKVVELTDPELFDHPFIYIVEPGRLNFSEEEVRSLRRYLVNGGFLLVDDFWGEYEWENLYYEIKRVFPDREPKELPVEHPIFNKPLPVGHKPQIPNFRTGEESQYTGITWERPDAREPHYRAISDDKGRIMVLICHNTDLGDGWEREGVYHYYFKEFSEKRAYPLAINILFYAMTH
jgi:hypothetical protein